MQQNTFGSWLVLPHPAGPALSREQIRILLIEVKLTDGGAPMPLRSFVYIPATDFCEVIFMQNRKFVFL